MIDISIVIPVYFNAGSLKASFLRLKQDVFPVFSNLVFEVIFVDDGSSDSSMEELLQIKKDFPTNLTIIQLSRNFGQVAAISAGYSVAKGNAVMNIAADMQEPTELLVNLIKSHVNNDAPIIVGQRAGRDETAYRKITSNIFYSLMRKLSLKNMPNGGFDVVLMNSKVKDLILSLNDAHPFWQGQILWTGFPIKIIPYERKRREVGKSRWTLSKKVNYLLDGVLSYSNAPLRFFSVVGILSFILGIIYSLVIVVRYFYSETPFTGWSPLMIVILLSSGVQLLMMGLISEYLWRIFDQAKGNPKYIINKKIE